MAVNFALIQEATRLGVRLDVFEAGGYEYLQTQKRQVAECVSSGAQACKPDRLPVLSPSDATLMLIRSSSDTQRLLSGVSFG